MADYLHQEMVAKILVGLPPKSLMRFRCVSKSWDSLISSPNFISVHTQQTILSARTDKIMVRRYSKAQDSEVYTVHDDDQGFPVDRNIRIEYPFRDDTRFYYRIVGACNGVLCLSDDLFGQTDSILLWNPVIKRRVALPAPRATFDDMGPYMFVLGFGFDTASNDYKVVRIAYAQGDYGYVMPPTVEVYALSRGNWGKAGGEVPKNCVVEFFWSQVVVGGNVHWIGYRNMGRHQRVESLIMVFSIRHEVFDEMQLPNALENELPINLCVVDLEGSVGVVQYDERVWSRGCCIWTMKNYGNPVSWSKKYSVVINGGGGMILGVRTNGDVLLSAKKNGLVSYDPVTRTEAELGIFGTKDSFFAGTYVETLALLIEGKEARERVPTPSDSESESENESSVEVENDDRFGVGDAEKSEFWMQSSMSQYLTVLLKR